MSRNRVERIWPREGLKVPAETAQARPSCGFPTDRAFLCGQSEPTASGPTTSSRTALMTDGNFACFVWWTSSRGSAWRYVNLAAIDDLDYLPGTINGPIVEGDIDFLERRRNRSIQAREISCRLIRYPRTQRGRTEARASRGAVRAAWLQSGRTLQNEPTITRAYLLANDDFARPPIESISATKCGCWNDLPARSQHDGPRYHRRG